MTQNKEEINLNEIVKPYFSKWKWFVVSVIIALLTVYLYLKTTVPVYNNKATVLIKEAKKSSGGLGDVAESAGLLGGLSGIGGMNSGSVDNEMEIFHSKKLLTQVAQNLNLQTFIYQKDFFKKVEIYKNQSPYIIKVISEKNFDEKLKIKPVHILEENGKITLESDDFESIQTKFNQTVSLPYANIMVIKNPTFIASKDFDAKNIYLTYSNLLKK